MFDSNVKFEFDKSNVSLTRVNIIAPNIITIYTATTTNTCGGYVVQH
jgi:hypothetical protein